MALIKSFQSDHLPRSTFYRTLTVYVQPWYLNPELPRIAMERHNSIESEYTD